MGSNKFLSTLKKAATVAGDVLTTKGDILSRSASTLGRLGVGSNNQVLTCDSTQTLGIKWAAASAGINNMEFVGFTEISGTSTTNITFGSLSYDMDTDYTDLILLIGGINSGGSLALEIVLNQDTAGYRQDAILNDGGTLSGTTASGATEWTIAPTGIIPADGYVFSGLIHLLMGQKSGTMHIESRVGFIAAGQQITNGDIQIGDTITEVKLQVSTQSFGDGTWAALFARPMNS